MTTTATAGPGQRRRSGRQPRRDYLRTPTCRCCGCRTPGRAEVLGDRPGPERWEPVRGPRLFTAEVAGRYWSAWAILLSAVVFLIRENVPRGNPRPCPIPGPDPASAADPGRVHRKKNLRGRGVRYREDVPVEALGEPPSNKDRTSPGSTWKTLAGCIRGTRRRHRQQSDQQDPARRTGRRRRHRPAPGSGDAARASTGCRRRLRERSVAISSNLHPAGFDGRCPKRWPPRPSTGVDYAHVCQTSAESVRCPRPSPGKALRLT